MDAKLVTITATSCVDEHAGVGREVGLTLATATLPRVNEFRTPKGP
jgi:hypothetical protein